MTNTRTEHIQFILVAAMLLFSPLIASGKSVYALLVLELIACCLLISLSWKNANPPQLAKPNWLGLTVAFLVPIVYLIPIPLAWWETLPGRNHYLPALQWLIQQNQSPWLSLSLVPEKTAHALLAILPLFALFLAVSSFSRKTLIRLAYLLFISATLQALLGLLQYSTKIEYWFFFAEYSGISDARGTYLNRDHFSVLMYMTLPLVIGLLTFNIGKNYKEEDEAGNTDKLVSQFIFLSSLACLLILAGILARSRAGVFLVIAGILLSSLLFARHIGGTRSASLAATIGMLSVGIASSIGLIPILNRFIAVDPLGDLRFQFFETSIQGIKQFFPVGSGPSTFQEIYRTIQPIEQTNFINHAHNDYLELLFETGAVGALLIGLFILIYLMGWIQLRGMTWNETRFLKVGAGISILLLLLHSFVDFNFHTPANAIVFAFMAAIFLRKEKRDNYYSDSDRKEIKSKSKRRRRSNSDAKNTRQT